jgi:hypothetical protein
MAKVFINCLQYELGAEKKSAINKIADEIVDFIELNPELYKKIVQAVENNSPNLMSLVGELKVMLLPFTKMYREVIIHLPVRHSQEVFEEANELVKAHYEAIQPNSGISFAKFMIYIDEEV